MWRLYRLIVGISTCHPLAKLGGYMVTFGVISAMTYTITTIFSRGESAYAGIIFLILVPSAFFGGLTLFPIGIYLAFKKQCLIDPGLKDQSIGEILRRLSGEHDVRGRIIAFVIFSGANVVLTFAIIMSGFQYLDSASFCGSSMGDEYTVRRSKRG